MLYVSANSGRDYNGPITCAITKRSHVNSSNMAFRVFHDKLINGVAKIPVIYNNRLKEFRSSTAKENSDLRDGFHHHVVHVRKISTLPTLTNYVSCVSYVRYVTLETRHEVACLMHVHIHSYLNS